MWMWPICDLLLATCLTIYGPGAISYSVVLERVAERRVEAGWSLSAGWQEYEVLVATADCRLLDRSGWLVVGDRILTAKVVDCEQQAHRGQMRQRGLLVDANVKDLNHQRAWLILENTIGDLK